MLLVATAALAGCAATQSGTSGGLSTAGNTGRTPIGVTAGPPLDCGPGAKPATPCDIGVTMVKGVPVLTPDAVNVHFSKPPRPVVISWSLDPAAVREGYTFRRNSALFFYNLDPDDDDVIGRDDLDEKFRAGAGTSVIRITDKCSKRCPPEGEAYGYQIIVYGPDGIAHVSVDPVIKNHPQ
jgi:hypothetical protein